MNHEQNEKSGLDLKDRKTLVHLQAFQWPNLSRPTPTLNLEGGERQGLKGPLNYLTPTLHRDLCGQPEYTAHGLLSTPISFSGHVPRGNTLSPHLWRGQYLIHQFRMTGLELLSAKTRLLPLKGDQCSAGVSCTLRTGDPSNISSSR